MKSIIALCAFVALAIASSSDEDVREKRCYLKPKQDGVGGAKCEAYFPSWSYNADADRCEFFVYGGCGGNDNRFVSPDLCVKACKASSVESLDVSEKDERCKQTPKKNGPCLAFIPSWSYNPATDRCEYFVYGGCGGNENRFSSSDLCVTTCQASTVDRP